MSFQKAGSVRITSNVLGFNEMNKLFTKGHNESGTGLDNTNTWFRIWITTNQRRRQQLKWKKCSLNEYADSKELPHYPTKTGVSNRHLALTHPICWMKVRMEDCNLRKENESFKMDTKAEAYFLIAWGS